MHVLCYVVEEGEGREGMAREALFLEASETQVKKLFDPISNCEQVQESLLKGRGILKVPTNLS